MRGCCDRCGVALTRAHGGRGRRLAVVADNGHMTSVELCGEHYPEALRAALEALLAPPARRPLKTADAS